MPRPALLATGSCPPGSFGAALECLKLFKRVRRLGWHGRWLELRRHNDRDVILLVTQTSSGSACVVSQPDMLAADWILA